MVPTAAVVAAALGAIAAEVSAEAVVVAFEVVVVDAKWNLWGDS
jgi:hypothetical protein